MARAECDERFRKVRRDAETQGWLSSLTTKGHWKFVPPDSGRLVYFSGSPGDYRAIKNFVAQMRRSGLVLS